MAKKRVKKPMQKSNKLRRTILGTLSGVFMISALIVAAIPVKWRGSGRGCAFGYLH